MNRRPLIFPLLCAVFFMVPVCGAKAHVPAVSAGIMDLTGWNFQHDGAIQLRGTWTFYRDRLLTPGDFSGPSQPKKSGYITFPAFKLKTTGVQSYIGASQYGTLRLRVRLPQTRPPLSLVTRCPKGACRLFVNGRLAFTDGAVGTGKETEMPGKRDVAFIPLHYQNGKYLDLLLQVSSHHGDPPGGVEPFQLGATAQLQTKWDWSRGFLISFVSVLLLMGCYHLSLFAFRPKDPSPLYFGLFCLLWMIYFASFSGNRWLVYAVWPNLGYMAVGRMEMIGYFFSIPFIIYFYRALFPDETPARISHLFMVAAGGLSLWLLSGLSRHAAIEATANSVSILAILFCTIVLVRAVLHRRPSSLLILSGSIILYICAINDILNDQEIIHTVVLMRLGLLVFILCQSWALARRFSKAFSTSESLFAEVQEKNIALSRLDELKDEFLANTSHELRTPLNGIVGISESLLTGTAAKLDDTVRSNLSMVVHSGRRLARLVDEILDFSRLKNSDVPIVKKPVDMAASAAAVTAVLERTLAGKEVVLETRLSPSLPPVLGDEDRIQQILYNLLGNAIKFTDKGRITLSATVDGEMLAISIADTGSGIPEEKLERIFEPFEQADAPAAAVGGTGLGLAITRKLVQLHGGRIWVENLPVHGACFTFTLPLATADAAGNTPAAKGREAIAFQMAPLPSPMPSSPLPAGPDGKLILVVDDDPINCRVAANHLTAAGHGVVTAAGGAKALEIIGSSQKPDLVLLDVIMPGMSGHEVCREIRKKHSLQTLPVVMLTAAGRTADLVEGFGAGANDYLTKPFSGQELIARIDTQLKLSQAYQTLAENVNLRKELAHRRQTELGLRQTQRRLAQLLDTVDDMMITVNESREFSFCNQAATTLLGYEIDDLLGSPVALLFADGWADTLDDLWLIEQGDGDAATSRSFHDVEITGSDGKKTRVDIIATPLLMEEERLLALIIRQANSALPSSQTALMVIEAVNRHQDRLRGLENSLNGLLPRLQDHAPEMLHEIRTLDQALAEVEKSLLAEAAVDRRQLGVLVMQLSVEYWYEATDMDKAALALESGIWKTYTDRNGYTRTQTLDKYLGEETLPQRPRWNLITNTAVYILAACTTPSSLRDRLENALARFRLKG